MESISIDDIATDDTSSLTALPDLAKMSVPELKRAIAQLLGGQVEDFDLDLAANEDALRIAMRAILVAMAREGSNEAMRLKAAQEALKSLERKEAAVKIDLNVMFPKLFAFPMEDIA